MSKIKTEESAGGSTSLSEQYGRAEKFVNENRKSLLIIAGSVVVLALLYIGYTKFYLAPREQEAINDRSEEHTSELQSLMRISYAVFCLKKKKQHRSTNI